MSSYLVVVVGGGTTLCEDDTNQKQLVKFTIIPPWLLARSLVNLLTIWPLQLENEAYGQQAQSWSQMKSKWSQPLILAMLDYNTIPIHRTNIPPSTPIRIWFKLKWTWSQRLLGFKRLSQPLWYLISTRSYLLKIIVNASIKLGNK